MTTEQQILIFSSPYLLASKIEAFISRGNNNFYSSPDVEDIIALLDGCSYLEEEVQQSSEELKTFLFSWFCKEFEILTEIDRAFLSSASRNSGRSRNILQIISRFAQS